MNKNDTGVACNTYAEEEGCISGFGGRLGRHGRVILKLVFKR